MPVLLEPAAIVALVLGIGGIYKVLDPAPTRDLLASLRLPAPHWAGRAIGLLELAVATAALVVGGPIAFGCVAIAFATFAVVTERVRRLGDAAPSCGCFGRLSARPSVVHVIVDAVGAGVATLAVVTGTAGYVGSLSSIDSPFVSVALVALCTWLAVMVMTVLPDTLDAARRGPAPTSVRTFELTNREIAPR